MNISEIAEQAQKKYASENYAGSFVKYDSFWFSLYNEKFAKLIAKECAGIYNKIDNGNLHMGTDDYLEALHKTFRSK